MNMEYYYYGYGIRVCHLYMHNQNCEKIKHMWGSQKNSSTISFLGDDDVCQDEYYFPPLFTHSLEMEECYGSHITVQVNPCEYLGNKKLSQKSKYVFSKMPRAKRY